MFTFQDESLGGTVHTRVGFCRHLLTFVSFQACMGWFLLLSTGEDGLKSVGG